VALLSSQPMQKMIDNWLVIISVAEPVYFLRLRLQLVKNFGSGSSLSKISVPAPTIFPIYFRKKIKFSWFPKNVVLFKIKNDHQKVL
jgi:hypothetical protein